MLYYLLIFHLIQFGTVVKSGAIFAVGGVKGFLRRDRLQSVREKGAFVPCSTFHFHILFQVEVFRPDVGEWTLVEPPLSVVRGPAKATIVRAAN